MELMNEINRYLDEQGRITLFPSKHKYKALVLAYLADSFEMNTYYTEKEVNDIIEKHHTFKDKWLLRRELIDRGFLERENDGSKYWKKDPQPELKEYGL